MLRPLLLLACAFVLCGCSHYQLGTGSTLAFRTLAVEPVANRTQLPQAQALLSTRLREGFARDARITLADASAADAVLTVTITSYVREVAAAREDDTGLARKFNVTLGATCTLRNRLTGAVIFRDRPVQAVREVFTDSGQLQAEYQTLPLLVEALTQRIVHVTLDQW